MSQEVLKFVKSPESLKFVNDIIKPWVELNDLLAQRYAFQPNLSDVTRMAASLALFISHYGEPKIMPKQTAQDSVAMKMMRDVADSSKHFKLTDPARQCEIAVRAFFKVRDDGQCRFLRNAVLIDHATEGELDFMAVALDSIRYWIDRFGLEIQWAAQVKDAANEFYPTAWLDYEAKYCINLGSTNIRFLKREGGSLIQFDPLDMIFEIWDHGKLGARLVKSDGIYPGFAEVDEQDAPGVDPWDKDPNYIWKPPRPDRDGGSHGLPDDGGLPG